MRLFICLLAYVFLFFLRYVYSNRLLILIGLIIFLLLHCKGSLYILDKNLLSDVCFANILSKSMICLFIFLTLSLKCKSFKFWWSQIIKIFSFIDCAFGIAKTSLPDPKLWRFYFMLSSKNFVVFLYLALIFGVWWETKFKFFHLYVDIQSTQHPWLKNPSFLMEFPCYVCRELMDHRCKGLFLESQFCSMIYEYMFILIPVPHSWSL